MRGPDVLLVGWIPYFESLDDASGTAFRQHRLARSRGGLGPAPLQVLFRSGNPEPPDTFNGVPGLDDYARRRHFRAFLLIRDLRLLLNDHHVAVQLLYSLESNVGYTPLQFPDGTRFVHGYGEESVQEELTSKGATLHVVLAFKLGTSLDFGSRVLTGRWAASAWIQVDYTINTQGAVGIDFGGTFIPSHKYFVDWRQVFTHDMMTLTDAEIDGFLDAGRCKDAPGRLRYQWTRSTRHQR